MSALLPEEEELLMSMPAQGVEVGPQSMPGQPMPELQALEQPQPSVTQQLATGYQPMPMPEAPQLSLSEEYLNNQLSNPRRLFWAGTLMDLGNLFGGWNGSDYGGRQMQGLGVKWASQARQQNREILERNMQRKQKAYQQHLQRWQLSQPKYMASGNDIMRIDPLTGQFSTAHQGAADPASYQIFGSAETGYYRLDAEGNPVPLVAPVAGQNVEQSNAAFNQTNTLRDDYRQEIGPYRQHLDSQQRAADSFAVYANPRATTPDGRKAELQAADKTLAFAYLKSLDPSSVVTEGELAGVSNSPGASDQVRSLYNRVINGEALSDDQRKALMREIEKAGQNAVAQAQRLQQQYTESAGRWGLNPGDVIGNRLYQPGQFSYDWSTGGPSVAPLTRKKPSVSTLAPDPGYQQQRTDELPTVPVTPDWNATITIPGL